MGYGNAKWVEYENKLNATMSYQLIWTVSLVILLFGKSGGP